jgi:cytochrome c553
MRSFFLTYVIPLTLASGHSLFGADSVAHFEKHIRPLFLTHCISCHGPDKQKGGLRLDSAAGWQTGGDSGPAIAAGDPERSRVLKAIRYTNRDLKMPPDGKLSEAEISAMEQWIREGAPDPRTGDATRVSAAKTPDASEHWAFKLPKQGPTPAVKDMTWPQNEIDHFVLAPLEAAGLEPAPDASGEVLRRRMAYDLLGLPASEFQDLNTALASPAFAERWGQHWLDAARFAESSGGGRTLPFKDAWRYRDYVIQSMADDVPLDRFISEQIAGDLLPYQSAAERRRLLTATGFLVLGAHNYEEQDKELLRMDIVDEQLETLGRSLLGMTISCARCHDHKFDPIPTADYYALAGILRSTKLIRDPKENVAHWIDRPLPLDGPAEEAMKQHEVAISNLSARLEQAKADLKKVTPKTEPKDGAKRPLAVDEVPGIVVDETDAKRVGDWKSSTRYPTFIGSGYLHDDNRNKGELSLTYIPKIIHPGRYEVRFSYTSVTSRAQKVPVSILHADGETDIIVDQSVLPPIDGRFISLGQYRFEATGQGFVLVSNAGTEGHVTADAVTFIPVDQLAAVHDARNDVDEKENPGLAAAKKQVRSLEGELAQLKKSQPERPEVMAVEEHEAIEDSPIHIRGSIRNLGKAVPRGFLQAAYHETAAKPIPANESGRVQLAEWITSDRNPLTARVLVNRVWMHLFGEGLVRTADNFGLTGEVPTHPELLDHLALYLQKHDWSLKKLIQYIVSSRTYQMASRPVPLSGDPENRLLHSQRRRRADANALRDAILVNSGALDRTYLGPNIANSVAVKNSNDTTLLNLEYGYQFKDTRRSVYTPAFRNKRLDFFDAFDFNDINQPISRRNTSTVSPQALYLMNHEFIIQQSRLTAKRLLSDGNQGDDQDRLRHLYHQLFNRQPTEREAQLALPFVAVSTGEEAPQARAEEQWALLVQSLIASPDYRFIE